MDRLLLHIFMHMNGQRSISGPVHILKGKRSSQTIQDIHLFRLHKWAGLLRHTSYGTLWEQAQRLRDQGFIEPISSTVDSVTQSGLDAESVSRKVFENVRLSGWKYEWEGHTDDCWRTLNLLIQTASHLKAGRKQFIPVYADTTAKQNVRSLFREASAEQIAEGLYEWLYRELLKRSRSDAELFTDSLSGPDRSGKTLGQMTSSGEVPFHTWLRFRSILHDLIESGGPESPECLNTLFKQWKQKKELTRSAEKTRELFMAGYDLQQIAAERRLKVSTIEDHFVEMAASDPEFPVDVYAAAELQREILQAASTSGGRLRDIRERIGEKADYFQIRLVLSSRTGKGGTAYL
ncbi:helix-turn-helix domain-containing protein [Alkalicoccus urumqiensis]|uniref:Helicase Helix-turn-helix domain-containing protein n=1 Tax=Alkalicoccus urumqiensis TaxID=1548213 RepID=A0A2P6MKF9_ALKUR|nr:helix-turn-helix domain-containing protein [Alkalicoccus urumqiensis]PRO66782.1 hypothetical protein C6I21_02345 [Alkalicoccus urumqiensis]